MELIDKNQLLLLVISLQNKQLFEEFESACQDVGIKHISSLYGLLLNLFAQSPRKYHSLNHMKFFSNIQKLNLYEEVNTATFILKKWFHDAVYTPTQDNNELESKYLWEQIAKKEQVDSKIIVNVSKGIEATIYGKVSPENFEDKVFCDTDLSILGQPVEVYLDSLKQIRFEYSHFNDEQFIQGRLKVNEFFSSLKQVYLTKNYFDLFEQQAKKNLEIERELLLSKKFSF